MITLSPFAEALQRRPRRNRQSAAIRDLVQETRLHPNQLIAPLFVIEGEKITQTISSLPGVNRFSIDLLLKEVIELYQAGIRGVDLFCMVSKDKKDSRGSEALRENNLLQQSVRKLKQEIPEMCVMVDIALDPYTDHGHDGVVNAYGQIDNDQTLPILAHMSLLAAEAGADFIAPSDMMDGRVAVIRKTLDQEGFTNTGIMSYAAKYASAFYGPFREALDSAPKFGDKKTYQMNPANVREALLECQLDEVEGADILMIKPALPFLDVIAKVRAQTNLPIAAYHVSGEYAMVMAAAQNGWLDADRALEECLLGIKRAGADMIFTYAAKRLAKKINSD
jgi:porphobilinogen synthase